MFNTLILCFCLLSKYIYASVDPGDPSNFIYPTNLGRADHILRINADMQRWLSSHPQGISFLDTGYEFPTTVPALKSNNPSIAYKAFYYTIKQAPISTGTAIPPHLAASVAKALGRTTEDFCTADPSVMAQEVEELSSRGAAAQKEAEEARRAHEAVQKEAEEARRETERLRRIIAEGRRAIAETEAKVDADRREEASVLSVLATESRETVGGLIIKTLERIIAGIQSQNSNVKVFREDKRIVESTIEAFLEALKKLYDESEKRERGIPPRQRKDPAITREQIETSFRELVIPHLPIFFKVSSRLKVPDGIDPRQWFLNRFVESTKPVQVEGFFQEWILDPLAELTKRFLDSDPEELSMNACQQSLENLNRLSASGFIEESDRTKTLAAINAVSQYMSGKVTAKREDTFKMCGAAKKTVMRELESDTGLTIEDLLSKHPLPVVLLALPYEMLFYLRSFVTPGKVVKGSEVIDAIETQLRYLTTDQMRAFFAYLYPLTKEGDGGHFTPITAKVKALDYEAGHKRYDFTVQDFKRLAELIYASIKKIPDDTNSGGAEYSDSDGQKVAVSCVPWLRNREAFLRGDIFIHGISKSLLSEYVLMLKRLGDLGSLEADCITRIINDTLPADDDRASRFKSGMAVFCEFESQLGQTFRQAYLFDQQTMALRTRVRCDLKILQIGADIKALQTLQSQRVDDLEQHEADIESRLKTGNATEKLPAKENLRTIKDLKDIRARYVVVEKISSTDMQKSLEHLHEVLLDALTEYECATQQQLNALLHGALATVPPEQLQGYLKQFSAFLSGLSQSETKISDYILVLNKALAPQPPRVIELRAGDIQLTPRLQQLLGASSRGPTVLAEAAGVAFNRREAAIRRPRAHASTSGGSTPATDTSPSDDRTAFMLPTFDRAGNCSGDESSSGSIFAASTIVPTMSPVSNGTVAAVASAQTTVIIPPPPPPPPPTRTAGAPPPPPPPPPGQARKATGAAVEASADPRGALLAAIRARRKD